MESQRIKSFTLVELLAVMLVIIVLAGISIGVANFTQKKMQTQITRTQLALLGAALENYKADWGFYPTTPPVRISPSYCAESTNNAILYRALLGQKRYLAGFPTAQLKTNEGTLLPNIIDVFGIPFNYYNSPGTTFGVSNIILVSFSVNSNTGYAVGGQVNTATYDLFSYGPDHYTSVPGAIATGGSYPPWTPGAWAWASSANDDITNWRR